MGFERKSKDETRDSSTGDFKKMGDQQILNNVDMECPCKSITGIIGRNGSGKTVLLKRHYEQGT